MFFELIIFSIIFSIILILIIDFNQMLIIINKLLYWFNISTHYTSTSSLNAYQLLNPTNLFNKKIHNNNFNIIKNKNQSIYLNKKKLNQTNSSLLNLPLSLSSSNSSFYSTLNLSVSDSKLASDSKLNSSIFQIDNNFKTRSLTNLIIKRLIKSDKSNQNKMMHKNELDKKDEDKSIHSGNIEEIYDVPMSGEL